MKKTVPENVRKGSAQTEESENVPEEVKLCHTKEGEQFVVRFY
jgi:hypothetical protein